MTEPAGRRDVTAADVAERLRGETRVLAVSHEGPDGDALGCLSAFMGVCDHLGLPCSCYVPGDSNFPPEYLFLPHVEKIVRGGVPPVELGTTVYFFDCASLLRSNAHGFPEDAALVNIDHHKDNPGFADLNLIDEAAPSASAILYEILKVGKLPVDAEVATGLYVGLVTDTGRFQYSNTTAGAHRMAAELQEAGVDVALVYRQVYESTPLPKLLLLERALSNLEVRLGGALVVSWLGQDDFVQAGADEGHAEGIIDTLRQIQGVRVAALVREKTGKDGVQSKASLRSTDGGIDVAQLAQGRGGGGHSRAAGFTTDEDVATVVAWIESQVEARL
jgi:bifunctional oligoribonuclease and PAP phosphatase NrnA